jgi:acyl-coenzyme A synthetase/AMP-(fatty) acid ligase
MPFNLYTEISFILNQCCWKVPPAELEALLVQHPDITDAAVIGVLDEQAGEVPMAFVVQRQGSNLSVESVLNYVSGQVAPYKELAGGVKFVDSIPKSASGKILRRLLRDQEAA